MFGKALVGKGVVFLDNSSGIKICSKYVQYRYCIKFHEKRNVLLNFFRFFTKWNYFCWNILNICHKAELWWYSAKFSMRLQFVTIMVSGKHWTALCSLYWPCWQWPVCVLATSTLNISMCFETVGAGRGAEPQSCLSGGLSLNPRTVHTKALDTTTSNTLE